MTEPSVITHPPIDHTTGVAMPMPSKKRYKPPRADSLTFETQSEFLNSLTPVPIESVSEKDRKCPHCWKRFGESDPGHENAEEPVKFRCGHVFGELCMKELFALPETMRVDLVPLSFAPGSRGAELGRKLSAYVERCGVDKGALLIGGKREKDFMRLLLEAQSSERGYKLLGKEWFPMIQQAMFPQQPLTEIYFLENAIIFDAAPPEPHKVGNSWGAGYGMFDPPPDFGDLLELQSPGHNLFAAAAKAASETSSEAFSTSEQDDKKASPGLHPKAPEGGLPPLSSLIKQLGGGEEDHQTLLHPQQMATFEHQHLALLEQKNALLEQKKQHVALWEQQEATLLQAAGASILDVMLAFGTPEQIPPTLKESHKDIYELACIQMGDPSSKLPDWGSKSDGAAAAEVEWLSQLLETETAAGTSAHDVFLHQLEMLKKHMGPPSPMHFGSSSPYDVVYSSSSSTQAPVTSSKAPAHQKEMTSSPGLKEALDSTNAKDEVPETWKDELAKKKSKLDKLVALHKEKENKLGTFQKLKDKLTVTKKKAQGEHDKAKETLMKMNAANWAAQNAKQEAAHKQQMKAAAERAAKLKELKETRKKNMIEIIARALTKVYEDYEQHEFNTALAAGQQPPVKKMKLAASSPAPVPKVVESPLPPPPQNVVHVSATVHARDRDAKHYEVPQPYMYSVEDLSDAGSGDDDDETNDTLATSMKDKIIFLTRTICSRECCKKASVNSRTLWTVPAYITWQDEKNVPDGCPLCHRVLFKKDKTGQDYLFGYH